MDAIQELLDQEAEGIGLDQRRNLVAKLELLQDFLHVGRKAIEVRLEIGPQLLLPGSGPQVAEAEGRRIVEGLAGRLTERRMLVGDTGLVQLGLHPENRVLRRLQDGIQAPNDGHGQDDVAVLAAHIHVAQHVVSDTPDKAADVQAVQARVLLFADIHSAELGSTSQPTEPPGQFTLGDGTSRIVPHRFKRHDDLSC